MTAKEQELRAIITKFKPAPQNIDQLVASLLWLRQRDDEWRRAKPLAIKRAKAEEMMGRIESNLETAQQLFSKLFPSLPGLDKPVPLDEKREGAGRVFRYPSCDRSYDDFYGPMQIDLFLFADMLASVQALLKKRRLMFLLAQPTYANVQEGSVVVAGIICSDAGIKISSSPNSQFYKIIQWLLGISDPKYVINKAKPSMKIGGNFSA